jgi:hypothetical protein
MPMLRSGAKNRWNSCMHIKKELTNANKRIETAKGA